MTDETVVETLIDLETADLAPEQGDNGDEGPSRRTPRPVAAPWA